jgi:hypothetical protein
VLRSLAEDAEAAVIKLNNGFSGQGNAIVDIRDLGDSLRTSAVTFCASEESFDSYIPKIVADGAIVEELLRAPGVVSPSVQVRIAPDASYEIVSSHDQILGGPDDQVYLGCRFPADERYRDVITDHGASVAKVLASKGVVGPFGLDFIVIPDRDDYLVFLSEINLRMGGTTHPFLMARLVTGGVYDSETGELVADGRPKSYIGTDNLKSDDLLGLEPQTIIDAVDRAGLAFDPLTKTGVTLHLLGALKAFGKMGVTCIADSRAQAQDLYESVVAEIERTAAAV